MWLKLTGAVNSSDPRYYYGYLLDVGDTVDVIRYIEKNEAASRLRIDNVPTPVLLVNHQSLRLRQVNAAARSQFGLARTTKGRLPLLTEVFPKANDATFEAILNALPGQPWAGRLDFNTIQGEPFKANTYLKWILWKQTAIIRISISQNVDETNREHVQNAETNFRDAPNLAAILGQALEHPDIHKCCNAIMISHVHPRANKVFVTGAGAPLADMPPCEEFSYRGTIAEDIDRFNLDHLVVDETMDSIKPIDWALFIPRGIRSYFAKPFYQGKTLRTVLILCSTEPNRFVGLQADSFDSVLRPLNKAARTLRSECGKRNGS
ncbi:hypothetical protein GKC30_14580 [Pseudodesulfovibrio sp. F-1]|uniref:PAS domain-containing protein n=1 Tax=Pseudodesulfovibrio alkaliphilus TaxID=2661613 RepID=A0A7K1KS22_9BACT|nr:hypothetical protein [Pseudodesulfovibrio alkaliphilus]MUM78858.1 hypothetical protein [Pseudodesulfovibrio alkaliphilus]